MQKDRTFKIRSSVYKRYKSIAELIYEEKDNEKELRTHPFLLHGNFPSVSLLKQTNLHVRIKDYLPFLIYYKDVYQNEGKEVQDMKDYLGIVFAKWVTIIPEKSYDRLKKMKAKVWTKLFIVEKVALFSKIVYFYESDEFEDFVTTLDYFPFMRAYGVIALKYKVGVLNDEIKRDLKLIWDEYFQRNR